MCVRTVQTSAPPQGPVVEGINPVSNDKGFTDGAETFGAKVNSIPLSDVDAAGGSG